TAERIARRKDIREADRFLELRVKHRRAQLKLRSQQPLIDSTIERNEPFRLEAWIAINRSACRRSAEPLIRTGRPKAVAHMGSEFRLALPDEICRCGIAGVRVRRIHGADRTALVRNRGAREHRLLQFEKLRAAGKRHLELASEESHLILAVNGVIMLLQFDRAGSSRVRWRVIEAEIPFTFEFIARHHE